MRGDWRLETGDWRLETGDQRLETGDWRLETRDQRREAGDGEEGSDGPGRRGDANIANGTAVSTTDGHGWGSQLDRMNKIIRKQQDWQP